MPPKAVDGCDQALVGLGIQYVAACSAAQHVACELLGVMHCQHQHFDVRGLLQDLPGGIQTVQLRQAQVHHNSYDFIGGGFAVDERAGRWRFFQG